MNKILIWDLPARFFHWAFAVTLTLAFILGLIGEDGGPLFQYHKLLGLVAVLLLVLRIILGVVGSRSLRRTSLSIRPTEIWGNFTGILAGRHQSYPGHTPGAALAAIAMFILVPLVFTGFPRGGEAFEELHAVLAYTLCGVVAAHILGLIVHTIRYRENWTTRVGPAFGPCRLGPCPGLGRGGLVLGLVRQLQPRRRDGPASDHRDDRGSGQGGVRIAGA
jgi:cytochrome b